MAYEGPQISIPGLYCGAVSLAAKQFYFVKLDADKRVVLCAAVTDIPIGVLQDTPAVGQACNVCTVGLTKVSSDAALVAGARIGPSADGQALTVVAGTVAGVVIEGTGAAGELATAFVSCGAPTIV